MVQNQETLKYSVAKLLKDERRDLLGRLEAEALVQRELNHPNVLRLEGFQEDLVLEDEEGNSITATGILMEYAPRGDMFDLLTVFEQMPLLLARSYAKQMVQAVSHIHEKKIAHQDIKLENFLVDVRYKLKLADFGFSRVTSEEQAINEQVGTINYWSPEQHEKNAFNGFETDVFSLGMSIFMLVTGRMPFEKATVDDEYYVNFIKGEEDAFWQMHEEDFGPSSHRSFFKDDFKRLINGML